MLIVGLTAIAALLSMLLLTTLLVWWFILMCLYRAALSKAARSTAGD